jgi:MFS family permease
MGDMTLRISDGARTYARKLRLFRRNARLYLLSSIITGLSFGVFRLLFNFYALSLGYDETLIGFLQTFQSTVALVGALPAGYLSDRLGRKSSLLSAGFLLSFAVLGMVFWRGVPALYLMVGLMGVSQSLSGVTTGPFLMENSGEDERTYLFSFDMGLRMMAMFVGNWLGGRLPTWLGGMAGVSSTSSAAYGWAIACIAGASFLGLLPLALLRRQRTARQAGEETLSPFQYARQEPLLLGKLMAPMLVTSLGAGLLMPFMNVFFRNVHGRSDAAIGTLFAWGSLAMGIGLLSAPPLADRWGKIRVVVITQALSIPFLFTLGFAPWFGLSALAYLARLALMNMSNPVYQAFVMERAEPRARATVASLVSMSWNVGWTISPTISGQLQVRYGFDPVFVGIIGAYVVAIYLYWRFFWRDDRAPLVDAAIEPAAGS